LEWKTGAGLFANSGSHTAKMLGCRLEYNEVEKLLGCHFTSNEMGVGPSQVFDNKEYVVRNGGRAKTSI
jgi:hypothetical protein